MNSEELELSLRAEFENYLKDVFAGMRQDVADLQKNFEAEFEKHKSQMDDAFRNLSTRFESDLKFDQAFTESVVEHLRLARDDGAQLSAQAFTEAQKLEESSASANYDRLRDAINDISGQATQSAILRSLVDHASQFAPRGAFFIVKHESFVCWRRFDGGVNTDEESVRHIHFAVSADTLLADAVQSLSSRESSSATHSEDSVYLDALGFGRGERMYAVPLVARGRGVAVFYVDGGGENAPVQLEAIESLVRVAGLTVELRAAVAASHPPAPVESPSYVPMPQGEAESSDPETVEPPTEETTAVEEVSQFEEYSGGVEIDEQAYVEEVAHVEPVAETEETAYIDAVAEPEEPGYPETVAGSHEASDTSVETEYAAVEVSEASTSDFAFASSDSYDASAPAEPEAAVEEYSYAGEASNGSNGHSYEPSPEPVVEVATVQPVKSRLSDRHVDLPIEVSDDERRLHNDARRFARLLVSEIKLYNEQRVNEGREVGDLYDRLREAIDRSREMYDKRVKPEVASKFDYFHYELVSNLAEGNDTKLGASYPGANV